MSCRLLRSCTIRVIVVVRLVLMWARVSVIRTIQRPRLIPAVVSIQIGFLFPGAGFWLWQDKNFLNRLSCNWLRLVICFVTYLSLIYKKLVSNINPLIKPIRRPPMLPRENIRLDPVELLRWWSRRQSMRLWPLCAKPMREWGPMRSWRVRSGGVFMRIRIRGRLLWDGESASSIDDRITRRVSL